MTLRPLLHRLGSLTLGLLLLAPTGVAQETPLPRQAIALGGAGPDSCKDVAMDDLGNAYVLGKFSDTAVFGTGAHDSKKSMGESDVFLARYDANGTCTWVVAIGGKGTDEPGAIALDGSANVYVVGGFHGKVDFDPGDSEAILHAPEPGGGQFLAKYDPEGKHLWSVHLKAGSRIEKTLRIQLQSAVTDVAVDGAGNAWVIGWFQGVADLHPRGKSSPLKAGDEPQAYFAGFNPKGECLWAQVVESEHQCTDLPFSLSVARGRVCFLAGVSEGQLGPRPFVAAYKGNGKRLWAHRIAGESVKIADTETYSETHHSGGWVMSGVADSQDGVVLAGPYHGIVNFDPTGRKKSGRIGAAGSAFGFVVRYSKGGRLSWVARTNPDDPDGDPRAITADAKQHIPRAVAVDARQNVYVTGKDRSQGFFVCAVSKAGKVRWQAVSSGASALGLGVAVDNKGSLVLAGHFTGKMSLPEVFSGALLTSTGSEQDGFLLRARSGGPTSHRAAGRR